jgi:hypothetical protein
MSLRRMRRHSLERILIDWLSQMQRKSETTTALHRRFIDFKNLITANDDTFIRTTLLYNCFYQPS